MKMTMPEMFEIVPNNENTVVRIAGKTFNYACVEPFKKTMNDLTEDRKTSRFVLDFSDVTFVDSLALGALAYVNYLCVKKGKSVVLCGLDELIRKIFQTSKIDSIFQIFPDMDSACQPAVAG